MKKYLNLALVFLIYGLCSGVYFREFTKFNNFSSRTTLGMAHPHILLLGFGLCLVMAIFYKIFNIEETKKANAARRIYVVGLVIATIAMIFRGTLEVINFNFTDALNGAISGIAGLGHMAVGIGSIMMINVVRKNAK